MEYIPLLSTVSFVFLLAIISPGPDFIMVVKNSLQYSRKIGIFTAVGFCLAILVHIFYCMAGLAVLISKSILVFNILKLLGAAYLIYIGWKSFFSKSSVLEIEKTEQKKDISVFEAIKIGFLTNLLNPKATLFFLSLFTFVVSPDIPYRVLASLTLIMLLIMFGWFSLVAIFFTQKKVQETFSKFQNIFNKVFGGILMIIGIKVALASK